MIPIKLQLKNFLSYGSDIQTIDFSTYPFICLSGKNGHGKSALLDAITWAIWGQARKIAGTVKADQGLLRLGQTQMMVCLDFECNRTVYRIKREFAQTYGKPYAALEFGIVNTQTDTVTPLTDKTIRSTQETIERTIHLDFDSFVNSAFLRQGQSNEFSKKSPQERKEILANILGLNRYEGIRRRAMDHAKEASNNRQHLLSAQTQIQQEIATKAQCEQTQALLEQEFIAHKQAEEKVIEQLKKVELDKTTIEHTQKEFTTKSALLKQLKNEYTAQLEKLTIFVKKWRTTHAQLLHQPNSSELQTKKNILVSAIQKHQLLFQQSLSNKEQLLKAKELCTIVEQRLKAEYQQLITATTIEHEKLKAQLKNNQTLKIELEQKSAAYQSELAKMQALSFKLHNELTSVGLDLSAKAVVQKQFDRRKEYYHTFVAQRNMLHQELASLQHKQTMVGKEDPSCPLCEQNLTASRKKFLKKKFDQTNSFTQHQYNRLCTIAKKLKDILIAQHDQLQVISKKEEAAAQLKNQLAEASLITERLLLDQAANQQALQAICEQIEQIDAHIIIVQKEALELGNAQEQFLHNNEQYKLHKKRIAELEQTLQTSNYNAQKHAHCTKELQAVEDALQGFEQIANQKNIQEQRKIEVQHIVLQLKTHKKNIIAGSGQLEQSQLQCAPYNSIIQQESALKELLKTSTQHKEAVILKKGSIEQEIKGIQKREQEYAQHAIEIKKLDKSITDYQAVAQATGKDGIQALLIEDAIPEIEYEANELLSKLTDNQAHIFIESIRDLKKGGTKETLDIKISDSVGIRPYELFSGGEGFRIDFALRVAISKLLARRAGTALQTLIIDEGFGSQDEDGLAHIMDALYKIQDSFNKIIIVSHLPLMKEQFPVHFIVEKGPNGSQVTVIEYD